MAFVERTMTCDACHCDFGVEYLAPRPASGECSEVTVHCPSCMEERPAQMPVGTVVFVAKPAGAARILGAAGPPSRADRS